jgi:transposase
MSYSRLMAPVDRKNPVRAKPSESSFSYMEFAREFPDDDACLEWLWRQRYAPDGENAYCPHCGVVRKFKRYDIGKQAWTCTSCSKRLTPTAGTIFHKSSTSLHLWFFAMWIMTSTRCGVSAKQLERELGVTYKTAWRMFNLIRNRLMTQDYTGPLGGEVEADETWIGGKMREGEKRRKRALGEAVVQIGPHAKKREVAFATVERGGRVIAIHLPSRYGYTLRNQIRSTVKDATVIYTDDYSGYSGVERRYQHYRINHSAKTYVDGHVHTQTVEGFFSLVKNGIRGVYHSVSPKWLQGYLNEYAWRYNHREDGRAMFLTLLERAAMSS